MLIEFLKKVTSAWDRLLRRGGSLHQPTGWKPIPRSVKRLLAASMLCVLLAGCGPWIGDPLVEVIGEVTLDSKVLKNAKVVFVPLEFRNADGLINPLAFGKTDGTGRFELKSGEQKGVLLGRYRVLIFTADTLAADDSEGAENIGDSGLSDQVKQDVASKPLDTALAELLNEPKSGQTLGETVPAKYNLHSELEYGVEMPVGIVYPKFHLTSD